MARHGNAATCDQQCGETHSVGGAFMQKRLVGLLASAVVGFAAGGTAASPSPSASAAASAPAPSAGTSAEPASPSAEVIDLTNTAYAPEEGTDGGTIIIGDWQEANQFNPFY